MISETSPRTAADRAPEPSAAPERRTRIGLVTAEFHGLFKNGGIGTANTGLALALVAAGFEVVVAFVDPTASDDPDKEANFADVQESYRARGLTLELVPRHPLLRVGHQDHVAASYSVYGYLQARAFDIVFFNECGGQGYFSLLAKRAGQFPRAPRMFVVTHGSNEWVLDLNSQLYWGMHPIAVGYLERRSVELADVLISPSRYLVGWMTGRGWRLPERTHVIQNLLPPTAEAEPPAPGAVTELVFFGRLEARKGLELFCEAISGLQATHDFSKVGVTFMGKFSRIGGIHSGVYVIERSRKWKVSPSIVTHYGQAEAVEYLRRPGVLAVIPSHAENSPCVVAECLIAGIPFIATNSGGTAELVAPDDRDSCLIPPTAEALQAKLGATLASGCRPARMAIPREESRSRWLELVSGAPEPAPDRGVFSKPRVSICLARAVDAPENANGFQSLLAQTYPEFEIVTVDYGAASDAGPEMGPDARVRRFQRANPDRSAARNAAAALASADWLLLVEERDVLLKPTCLAAFVEAAARFGADAIAGPALEFGASGLPIDGWDGQLHSIPVGADIEQAAFKNCLGQSVVLIARRAFEAVGGFETGASEAIEDRLLLTKLILDGGKLEICPKPQFWRRMARARVAEAPERGGDQRRILRAYEKREIRLVERALETVLSSGPRNRQRVLAALAGLGNAAKEIATRLSLSPQQGGPDPAKPFVEYCVARGRFREACEFARLAEAPSLLAFARGAASAAAEKTAFGAIRAVDRDESHRVPLSRQVAERLRPLTELREAALARGGENVVAYPIPLGTAILKAPAVCPPGATLVEASVVVDAAVSARTRFALAVCEPFARLSLENGPPGADEGAWWSGWIAAEADGGETIVTTRIPVPVDRALDIFLVSRLGGFFSTRGLATWRSVGADINLFGQSTASAIELDPVSSSLPRHVIARGEQLTRALDFNAPYFVPGDPTMHHPLPGRPALVRIPNAIFPGATGVRAVFSVESEHAHPVEFAFWARKVGDPVRDVAGLEYSDGFSGWTPVRAPFQPHQSTLTLAAPARQPLDLYIATRVVEFPDVDYCHAAWHDFFVLEELISPPGTSRRGETR